MTKRSSTEVSEALGVPSHNDWLVWTSLLRLIDYKPGWSLELIDHRKDKGAMAVRFKMIVWDTMRERELTPLVVTTDYTIPNHLYGQNFMYSKALDWLRGRIHEIEKHEADEWFRFDGMQCFNPHGPSQMLGRRVEGWEWFSPAALSIAPHLKERQ